MKRLFLLFSMLFCLLLTSVTAQQVIYVDKDAQGANNGSSWENAYTDLSVAIASAQSGSQIWVSAGVYYPTSQPNYPTGSSNPRFNHFTLKNGVSILGGFLGSEVSVDQRNVDANITVLSADIDRNDDVEPEGYITDYTKVLGENAYKIFYFPPEMNVDTTAVLDGFTLTSAWADNDVFPYMGGAAMLCRGASPKVVNCTFRGNYAKHSGGAIWVENSSMIIDGCTFIGNYAGSHGGAVCFQSTSAALKNCHFINNTGKFGGAVFISAGDKTSIIDNCIFDGNQTLPSGNGGGISISSAKVLLKNTSITKNVAADWGGGVVFNGNCDVDVLNCEILSNRAGTYGGGIGAHSGAANNRINLRITNVRIQGNESGNRGGGISFRQNADAKLVNTLIAGNKSMDAGSGIEVASSSKVDITNATIIDNVSSVGATSIPAIRVWDTGSKVNLFNSILYHTGADFGYQNANMVSMKFTRYTDADANLLANSENIITSDPRFIDAPGHVGEAHTNGNYRLWGNSPVNNKGSNAFLPKDIYDLDGDSNTTERIPYDLDGRTRIFAGVVDIGCYEQQFETVSGNMLSVYDNQHVQMGNGVPLNDTDFTIEFWIKPRPDAVSDSWHTICGSPTGLSPKNRAPSLWIFQYDRIHYGYGDGTNWNAGDTQKALKIGQWNHIAMTFNKSSRTLTLFANGKQLERLVGAGNVISTPLQFINQGLSLRADIDEFRVWKEERSLEQLIQNMHKTLSGNEQNLSLYYPFDDVTGDATIEDRAGSNNGTLINNPGLFNSDAILTPLIKEVTNVGIDYFTISWFPVPNAYEYFVDVATDPNFVNMVKIAESVGNANTFTVNGLSKGTIYYYKVKVKTNSNEWGSASGHTATRLNPPGNAFAFDGSTYIDATHVCKYPFEQGTTIETWVKNTNRYQAIWACNTSAGLNNYILFSRADGRLLVAQQNSSGSSFDLPFDNAAVLSEGWNHVAVTIDAGLNVRIYVNGVYKGSGIGLAAPFPYSSKLSLGQEFDKSGETFVPSDFYIGEFDEFRVWNRALTQEEIQEKMSITLNGQEEGLVTYYGFDHQSGATVIDLASQFDGYVIGTPQWVPSTVGMNDFVAEAANPTFDGFTISWNQAVGATGYSVDVATDAQFSNTVIASATAAGLEYTVTGLEPGTKYYFRVNASTGQSSVINYSSTLMQTPGNALLLNGVDDWVEANQVANLDFGTKATIESWVWVDPSENRGMFWAINTSTGGNRYLFSYENGLGYNVYRQLGGARITSKFNTKGTWVHIAATIDAEVGTKLYINGVLEGTIEGAGTNPFINGDQFSLGQEFDNAQTSDFFRGAIDELRIWRTIRTPEQLIANMHRRLNGDEDGLMAYFDFDQNEGQFVTEKLRGLNGTIINNPKWIESNAITTPLVYVVEDVTPFEATLKWYSIDEASDFRIEVATDERFRMVVKTIPSTSGSNEYRLTTLQPGTDYYVRVASKTSRWSTWSMAEKIQTLLVPPGNALAFDGVDGMVDVGRVQASNWGSATLEAWVKLGEQNSGISPRIISNYEAGARGMGLVTNNNGRLRFEFRDQNSTYRTCTGNIVVTDNVWHHVASTFDGSTVRIYVDGELDNEVSFPAGTEIKQSFISFAIGNQNDGVIFHPLRGAVDEVRLWNVARSVEQIREFAHKPLLGNESGLLAYYNLDRADGNTFQDQAGNFDGTMSGGVTWAESKALITPFAKSATDISSVGFTAHWTGIPGAQKYFLRVATDPLLTQLVEGWGIVDVGNVTSFNVTGLTEHTVYYYGVMSKTDRLSAWSPCSPVVKTLGGEAGPLAIDLSGSSNFIDISAHISRIAGRNTGAITGWFKGTQNGTIIDLNNGSETDYMRIALGDIVGDMSDESFWFIVKRNNALVLSLGVREGHRKYLDGSWHHFAIITGDGDNRILIDGIEKKVHFYNNIGNKQTPEFSRINNPVSLTVGKGRSVVVDELAFYVNPITNEEVIERAHRPLEGNEVGLVFNYNFDQVSSTTITDVSGKGRNALIAGAVSYQRANVLQTPFLNEPVTGVVVADLSWTAIPNATEYEVDIANDRLFTDKIHSAVSVSLPTYRVDNLNMNSRYYYRVRAKVNGEWSEWSATGEFFQLPGRSMAFDPTLRQYIRIDGVSNYYSEQATIECWVKGENVSSRYAIWAHNNGVNNTNQYVLMYNPSIKELRITSMNSNTPNDWVEFVVPGQVNLLGAWNHIAVSIIKDGESAIYINGKRVLTFNHHFAPIVNGYHFSIGQEWDDNFSASDFFKGELDEFRVWNIALTEQQIRENMNISKPAWASEHFIAHYTFDEIHDNVWILDNAKSNHGRLFGLPTTTSQPDGASILNPDDYTGLPVLKNSNGVIVPITLEPTQITSGSFTLNLNNIVSAESFELEVAYDPTFVPPLAMLQNIGKTTSYSAQGLCPGVKYYYRVRALYGNNTVSAWSAYDTVSTVAQNALVTNFTATQGDYSQRLRLTWACSFDYLVTEFVIKRRVVGENQFEYLATVPNDGRVLQYIDTQAEPGTYYQYSIQGISYCYNNDTEVAISNIGFNIPSLTVSKELSETTNQAYIRLDWKYHPNYCNNVEIRRNNIETGITQTFLEVADSLVYRDGEVELCQTYSYQLVAKTSNYGDISSQTRSFTLEEDIFDAIDTLDASKGYFDSKITLNWVSHKQNIIDEYQISRRRYAAGSNWQVVKIIDKGTTQTWIDEDAVAGEYYEYLIVGIGSCGNISLFTDTLYSVGFRQPEGTISGQINYQGGNPVRDVKITALYNDASRVLGRCVQLDGTGFITIEPRNTFTFENGQTVEMWIRPASLSTDFILFQNSGLMAEYLNTGELSVLSGSALVGYNLKTDDQDIWDDNSWNHIAIVSKANELQLFINGIRVAAANAAPNIVFSEQNVIAAGLVGFVDELRIWNIAKTDSLINRHHKLVLGRSEMNLICALRFDEGIGTWAFDHTRTNDEPNKSHAIITNGAWSENVPSPAKLSLAALTEPTGNYQINGVRFKGSGDTYRITPSLGVHQFDPASRSMLVSQNSLVYSNQDFTDISSFKVTGNVKYFGADFPVSGVMLAVDGQICVNPEGAPIVTDQYGNFSIEVPIGNHFISVAKMGHVFSEGYFPAKSANGEVNYFNFNDNISGIQFIDSTFLTVAGRIVGGTVEGDKVLGFGKSVNNLGVSSFTVKAVKGYPIEADNFEVTVYTNPETGEYELKLFPEQFEFVGQIGNSMYQFNSIEDKAIIDLSGTMMETTETDTLANGDIQTYKFHLKRNWIYRSVPTINVISENGSPHFYDLSYLATDDNDNEVEINLINEGGNHVLGYPVFTKGKKYTAIISVFEQYENADNGEFDQVPVTDGKVTTINTCATYPAPVEHEIAKGIVKYEFIGGFPNPTIDDLNPGLSYTKTFEVHAATGNQGSIHSQWPKNGTFRAYVFGGIPTGNNFVTQGPDLVDFILRDPAGSNSHAFFETGFTVSNSTSNSFSNSAASSMGVEVDLGWEITTFVGFGAGIISTNEQIANVNTGVGFESKWESGQSFTTTTTFNKSYSTSNDPAYVGKQGDLFFGHSTNISYGVSNYVKLVPVGQGDANSEIEGVNVNGFTIGRKKGINFGLKYNTDFIYSLNHIENYLIPDLEGMAEYFIANGNPDSASYYQQQADIWKGVLAENEYQKYYAMNNADPQDKNISFDAGAIYEESITTEVTETRTSSFEFSINSTVSSELGFEIMGVGTTWSFENSVGKTETSSSEDSQTTTTTVGFALNDGDQGDYFSVDVMKCHFGNGPIFVTKGGQSACPYEGGHKVEYADFLSRDVESGFVNGYDLNFPTMRIEVPRISAERAIISGVPENKPAEFMLKLSNQSEVGADSWFTLVLDGASNPYGARLLMDGASIANGVSILVPGGKTLTKMLQFYKGRSDINDYENINVILHSQCQFDPTDDLEDISDTVRLTANFVPTCSDVDITNPGDGWLVNIAADDKLPLTIGRYNLQHGSFEKIALQYKPESASSWNTAHMFFNDTTNFASYTSAKEKINGRTSINYVWDMSSLQDRVYQIRAVSMCFDGSVTESQPLKGTLDGKRPEVFGTPSPADGILSPGEDIMISFSEPIEEGLVTYYNISVEGVLNGVEINHGTSVSFDGYNDYVVTPEGINLSNLSYAIEFWMQKEPSATGTVISTGRYEQGTFSISFSADSVVVNVDDNSYKTKNIKNDGDWHHWAVVYNNTVSMLYIYADDQLMLEIGANPSLASGAFYFGKQCFGNANHFTGNLHDVRIWRKALGFNEVIERMNIALTGNEVGLIGYWPMDEAKGNVLLEKARSRHASMFAEWNIQPGGYAYNFNGIDRVLTFAAGAIPINSEMDMTIELWFKTEGQAANGYLFSNGNTSIETYPMAKTLNLYMNPQGQIVVENNGQVVATQKSYNDNNWHHLAFVVNRRAYATLYVDGEGHSSITAPTIGSLEGPIGYIGARGYIDNSLNQHFDGYFNGSIDEVRIWNTARRQEQIVLYMNNRLKGTETGLKAYFPFEKYEQTMGVMLSVSTLDDQSVDPNSQSGASHCGTASSNGSEGFTNASPAIRRARAKSNVNFDFVTNNDRIIITPTDPLALIERCILEITVKNIEDKNANRMASPVSWTAYIEKNQVRWGQDEFSFQKELNSELSFETTVKNIGGAEQAFSISNLPAWLTVIPSNGTLPPNSSVKVKFSVNNALNIGNYAEELFLESGSGYAEKLILNLKVYKNAPDWNVDETAFSTSMNIIGKLRIKGVFSTDTDDMIAAFAGNECRGVAKLVYKSNYDDYFAFLVVYGNTAGESLTYKVWDASEGRVYSDVTPSFEFAPNALHGSMANPTVFEVSGLMDYSLSLNSGWNWLSFNLEMNNPTIANLFSNMVLTNGDIVKHADLFSIYDKASDLWFGPLENVEIGKLYRVYSKVGGALSFLGSKASVTDYPIELVYGWNRIGYVPNVNLSVNEALAGFEPQVNDVVKSQYQFAMWDGFEWIGSLITMRPGAGYMYKSFSFDPVTFIYPESSSKKFGEDPLVTNPLPKALKAAQTFEYSMSVIAQVNGDKIPENAQVAAYVNGTLRGVSNIFNSKSFSNFCFITISGDAVDFGVDVVFTLISGMQEIELLGMVSFANNDVEGTLNSPVPLKLQVNNESFADLLGDGTIHAFPNPFAESVVITFVSKSENTPKVKVMNALGMQIANLVPSKVNDATYKATWNGITLNGTVAPYGMYYVVVSNHDEQIVIQIVKSN